MNRCRTCRFAALYGERGFCRRPDAGKYARRPLSDAFLPGITADMYCGSHPAMVEAEERTAPPQIVDFRAKVAAFRMMHP